MGKRGRKCTKCQVPTTNYKPPPGGQEKGPTVLGRCFCWGGGGGGGGLGGVGGGGGFYSVCVFRLAVDFIRTYCCNLDRTRNTSEKFAGLYCCL